MSVAHARLESDFGPLPDSQDAQQPLVTSAPQAQTLSPELLVLKKAMLEHNAAVRIFDANKERFAPLTAASCRHTPRLLTTADARDVYEAFDANQLTLLYATQPNRRQLTDCLWALKYVATVTLNAYPENMRAQRYLEVYQEAELALLRYDANTPQGAVNVPSITSSSGAQDTDQGSFGGQ